MVVMVFTMIIIYYINFTIKVIDEYDYLTLILFLRLVAQTQANVPVV